MSQDAKESINSNPINGNEVFEEALRSVPSAIELIRHSYSDDPAMQIEDVLDLLVPLLTRRGEERKPANHRKKRNPGRAGWRMASRNQQRAHVRECQKLEALISSGQLDLDGVRRGEQTAGRQALAALQSSRLITSRKRPQHSSLGREITNHLEAMALITTSAPQPAVVRKRKATPKDSGANRWNRRRELRALSRALVEELANIADTGDTRAIDVLWRLFYRTLDTPLGAAVLTALSVYDSANVFDCLTAIFPRVQNSRFAASLAACLSDFGERGHAALLTALQPTDGARQKRASLNAQSAALRELEHNELKGNEAKQFERCLRELVRSDETRRALRLNAIAALGKFKSTATIRLLMQMACSAIARVRTVANKSLAEQGVAAVPLLLESLAGSAETTQQRCILKSIRQIGRTLAQDVQDTIDAHLQVITPEEELASMLTAVVGTRGLGKTGSLTQKVRRMLEIDATERWKLRVSTALGVCLHLVKAESNTSVSDQSLPNSRGALRHIHAALVEFMAHAA